MKKREFAEKKLTDYKNDQGFQYWYCYMEDKWLQNADWEEKLTALFGSVENAIERYEAHITQEKEDC